MYKFHADRSYISVIFDNYLANGTHLKKEQLEELRAFIKKTPVKFEHEYKHPKFYENETRKLEASIAADNKEVATLENLIAKRFNEQGLPEGWGRLDRKSIDMNF